MKIFLTGKPGSGKSTVLGKILELLNGIKVGGFVTPEIIEGGKRVGFYIKDVFSKDTAVLASKDIKIGPKVGRYGIDVESFERVALKALDFAVRDCDLIAIDEIGKMELFSYKFREKISEILLLDKSLIAVLHSSFVKKFGEFGKIVEVNNINRENLPKEIAEEFIS